MDYPYGDTYGTYGSADVTGRNSTVIKHKPPSRRDMADNVVTNLTDLAKTLFRMSKSACWSVGLFSIRLQGSIFDNGAYKSLSKARQQFVIGYCKALIAIY